LKKIISDARGHALGLDRREGQQNRGRKSAPAQHRHLVGRLAEIAADRRHHPGVWRSQRFDQIEDCFILAHPRVEQAGDAAIHEGRDAGSGQPRHDLAAFGRVDPSIRVTRDRGQGDNRGN
jgi:hypothetical protein